MGQVKETMFFFACDMGGKIKPNKTIKNVLGLVEGENFLQVKKFLNFFTCYLEEVTQNSSNCPKEYERIFFLQKI